MIMREGETLKTYSDRYWEMFNEIDGDFEDMAIRTFKVALPTKHDLRKSLTMKHAKACPNLWIRLTSTSKLRWISGKGKGRQRLLLLTKEISGWRDIITTNLGGILLDILGILVRRWLVRCLRNLFIRSLKR